MPGCGGQHRGCDDNNIIKATADARSSERIGVTNYLLQSQCAGLGLDAETTHAIRNVTFANCVCDPGQRPIQIEMWEPGLIENFVISNRAFTTRGRLMITAQDGAPIEDVTIRDVPLTYPETLDWPTIIANPPSNQDSNYSSESRGINSECQVPGAQAR